MYDENEKQVIEIKAEAGKDIIVRKGEAPELYRNYKGIVYTAHSTQSFIDIIKRRGSEQSVIAYNEGGLQSILDDSLRERAVDKTYYDFKESLQYQEWKGIIDHEVNQKYFIKFLQRREECEVRDIEQLIYALQNFRFVTNLSGDFSQADNNNYTFMFKSKDGEGTVKIPQTIYANIEIYNESDFPQTMEIEIEVNKPKEAGQQPTFTLTCPKMQRYIKAAMDNEIHTLKKAFPDDFVVAGSLF